MLKKSKGLGKLRSKDTVQLIKSEVKIHEQKLRMAPTERGEQCLAPQYKQLGLSEEVYRRMDSKKKTQ